MKLFGVSRHGQQIKDSIVDEGVCGLAEYLVVISPRRIFEVLGCLDDSERIG